MKLRRDLLSFTFFSVSYFISIHFLSSSFCIVDMVDTQQLLAWPVGFSLSTVDLPELDDSSHCLDMKHLSTSDYASISSSSIPSSLSPPLVSSISSAGVVYDMSPSLSEEHLTNMDYTNMHSYRTEPDSHSKSSLWITQQTCQRLRFKFIKFTWLWKYEETRF